MARSNKYASINFNDIYEKKSNPINKPTSSSTASSLPHKTHGGMLVLTRPQPKPLPQLQPLSTPKPPDHPPSIPEPDPISLRPLGRTGSPLPSSLPSPLPSPEPPSSTKSEPFVPPHLRPGFVGKEEKFGQRSQNFGSRNLNQGQNGHVGNGEDGRPRSSGYDRTRRGVSELGVTEVNRPGSGGSRYGSSPSNKSPRF